MCRFTLLRPFAQFRKVINAHYLMYRIIFCSKLTVFVMNYKTIFKLFSNSTRILWSSKPDSNVWICYFPALLERFSPWNRAQAFALVILRHYASFLVLRAGFGRVKSFLRRSCSGPHLLNVSHVFPSRLVPFSDHEVRVWCQHDQLREAGRRRAGHDDDVRGQGLVEWERGQLSVTCDTMRHVKLCTFAAT